MQRLAINPIFGDPTFGLRSAKGIVSVLRTTTFTRKELNDALRRETAALGRSTVITAIKAAIDELDKPNPITKRFEDTVDGVKAMLDELFDHPAWSDDVTFTPDPQVYGVWMVEWPCGTDCIAYLAGHREPMGGTREVNDAEFGYPDDQE